MLLRFHLNQGNSEFNSSMCLPLFSIIFFIHKFRATEVHSHLCFVILKKIFLKKNSFLTLSNKVKNCLCIRFVCLSVYLSVCARSNSRKYPSNVLKFKYVTHIWYRMNRIENDTWGKVFIYRNTQKFSNTLRLVGGIF